MTEPRPRKINPFLIPGREDAPVSALCPWKDGTHTDLYIEVDNYAPAFDDFQDQFTNPSLLKENSRLALVVGDTGCGKSALRNHCAHWLGEELVRHGMRGEIVDVSWAIDSTDRKNQIIDITKRVAHVGEILVGELAKKNLITAAARDDFVKAGSPDQIYAELASAMDNKGRSDVVLILLLPSSDHPGEIEQYVAMRGPRVVFFAESAYLRPPQVGSIGAGNDVEVPPATMTVGQLSAEDIRLFVETRYDQRQDDGVFPRLADVVLTKLMSSKTMSIAMLQRLLTGLYTHVRKVSKDYTNDARISADELTNYLLQQYSA